jgi:hypothetical protein
MGGRPPALTIDLLDNGEADTLQQWVQEVAEAVLCTTRRFADVRVYAAPHESLIRYAIHK